MTVNGYQIREAIKRWILQRDLLVQQFKEGLYAFEGEAPQDPEIVMAEFRLADESVARLEELQQAYNSRVTCDVGGQPLRLSLCIKMVGGAGRREKMWREAATGKRDRYPYRDENRERDKTKEYAKRLVNVEQCVTNSRDAAKFASALRNAIARGNSTEIEIVQLGLDDQEGKRLFA